MGKELFDQSLKVDASTSDRIALGEPGVEGCDNMTVENFLKTFFQYGKGVSVTSGSNVITLSKEMPSDAYAIFIRSYGGIAYEITAQTTTTFTINMLANDTIDYLIIKI